MARSAATASWVSLASSPPVIAEGPELSAASTSARLVIDLDPGGRTRALTGPAAGGACQVLIQLSVSSSLKPDLAGKGLAVPNSGNETRIHV
jgi:hypothetical protein